MNSSSSAPHSHSGSHSPVPAQSVDAHQGQLGLPLSVRAQVQIHHFLHNHVLRFNGLRSRFINSAKGSACENSLLHERQSWQWPGLVGRAGCCLIKQELIAMLTIIMSVKSLETSIPNVMYAMTFFITSRFLRISRSTLMFFRSCENEAAEINLQWVNLHMCPSKHKTYARLETFKYYARHRIKCKASTMEASVANARILFVHCYLLELIHFASFGIREEATGRRRHRSWLLTLSHAQILFKTV